jgi:hypothetical protein
VVGTRTPENPRGGLIPKSPEFGGRKMANFGDLDETFVQGGHSHRITSISAEDAKTIKGKNCTPKGRIPPHICSRSLSALTTIDHDDVWRKKRVVY